MHNRTKDGFLSFFLVCILTITKINEPFKNQLRETQSYILKYLRMYQEKVKLRGKPCISCGYQYISDCTKTASQFNHLTFHVADLILTVRPLLVSVHFIRRKKLRSVFCSLVLLDTKHGQKIQFTHLLLIADAFICRKKQKM